MKALKNIHEGQVVQLASDVNDLTLYVRGKAKDGRIHLMAYRKVSEPTSEDWGYARHSHLDFYPKNDLTVKLHKP